MVLMLLSFALPLADIDPELEEAITAIEENAAKFSHGRAMYTVEKRNYGSEKILESLKVESSFSGRQYAWEKGDWKYVWTPEQVIWYFRRDRHVPKEPERARNGESVFINSHSQSGAAPWLYSPNTLSLSLMQSTEGPPSSIGANISNALEPGTRVVFTQKVDQRLMVTIAYSHEHIARVPGFKNAKDVYVLDPRCEYMPVIIERWGRPDGPYKRYMSAFNRIDGDVWVAEKVVIETWKTGDDGRWQQPTYTIKLDEIDLKVTPDESTFTVDWIAPPVGTRIQDRINGTESQFGVENAEQRN